jgi:hypothetical protein
VFGTYISDKLNPFRRDIALNLSDFLPIKDEEENNIINITSQRGTYPWSFVTQIFHNGQPSHGGDRKTFEVMTST